MCVFAGLFRPLLQLTCMDRVLCAKNYSFTSNSGDFFTLYGRRASLAYWPRGSAFGLTECALHKQLFTFEPWVHLQAEISWSRSAVLRCACPCGSARAHVVHCPSVAPVRL